MTKLAAQPSQRPRALLSVVLLGTLLGPMDSAVNIGFPDITKSFGLPLTDIRWVIIAYVSTYASLMLIFGRVGDLFGHHRVFGGGLVVCILGFAICSLAPTYNWLLAARVLQGLGTAMVLSCGPALATNLFSEDVRPRVLGTYAMMFGLGGAVGPSLGGLLVDLWGWPAVFWFRLPLAASALILMLVWRMPAPARASGRFDFLGASLLALSSGLLLFTTSQIQAAGERPVAIALLAVLSVIALTAFVVVTRRSPTPVIPLGAFRRFSFTWINITNVVVNLTGFATMLFVPYFLVRVSALPLWQSGLVMAVGPIGMMLAANSGGRWVSIVGADRMALLGAGLVSGGLYLISNWSDETGSAALMFGLLVHGVGLGLFQVASLESVAASLPKSNRGVAGSLTLVMRTVGVVIAASTLPIVFTHVEQSLAQAPAIEAFLKAFQSAFRLTAYGLAFYTIASLSLPAIRRGNACDAPTT